MGDTRTPKYIATTAAAAMFGILGVYLPWVRKRPSGYTDGQPYYTSEYVLGLEAGIRGTDVLLIVLVLAVLAVTLVARGRPWLPDAALLGAGGLILVLSGDTLFDYWSVERYAVEPGLYLLALSGVIFLLVGGGAVLSRTLRSSE